MDNVIKKDEDFFSISPDADGFSMPLATLLRIAAERTFPSGDVTEKRQQVMKHVKKVAAEGYNPHYRFHYTELHEAQQLLTPLMAEAGIAVTPYGPWRFPHDGKDYTYLMVFFISTADGGFDVIFRTETLNPFNRNGIDGMANTKVASRLYKYALLHYFAVPYGDQDADGDESPPTSGGARQSGNRGGGRSRNSGASQSGGKKTQPQDPFGSEKATVDFLNALVPPMQKTYEAVFVAEGGEATQVLQRLLAQKHNKPTDGRWGHFSGIYTSAQDARADIIGLLKKAQEALKPSEDEAAQALARIRERAVEEGIDPGKFRAALGDPDGELPLDIAVYEWLFTTRPDDIEKAINALEVGE